MVKYDNYLTKYQETLCYYFTPPETNTYLKIDISGEEGNAKVCQVKLKHKYAASNYIGTIVTQIAGLLWIIIASNGMRISYEMHLSHVMHS